MQSEIPSKARIDAFTAEVIRSALVAITGEMKTNLMRTAYHTIIYEAEDFTVGLFDADGNTISIGLGLPMFIRGLSDAIKAKIAHWGKDNILPGDILLTNDSYIMGSHLNHMIYTLPIFNDGELVAFSSSMAHWQTSADNSAALRGIFFPKVCRCRSSNTFAPAWKTRRLPRSSRPTCACRKRRWAICARNWRRSAPASGA